MLDPNSAIGLKTSLIKFRRKARKSRREVASESGLTPFWVEKFEQGVLTNPTARNLDKLRAYLRQADLPVGKRVA